MDIDLARFEIELISGLSGSRSAEEKAIPMSGVLVSMHSDGELEHSFRLARDYWTAYWKRVDEIESNCKNVSQNLDLYCASVEAVVAERSRLISIEKKKLLHMLFILFGAECTMKVKGRSGLIVVPIIRANSGLLRDFAVLFYDNSRPSIWPISDKGIRMIISGGLVDFVEMVLSQRSPAYNTNGKSEVHNETNPATSAKGVRSTTEKHVIYARPILVLKNAGVLPARTKILESKNAHKIALLQCNIRDSKLKIKMLEEASRDNQYKDEMPRIRTTIKRLRNYVHVTQYRLNSMVKEEEEMTAEFRKEQAATIKIIKDNDLS